MDKTLKNIKAVIFDLDGTLLYTLQDIMDALNETLALYQYRPYSLEEGKYLIGNGARKLLERALAPYNVSEDEFNHIFSIYKVNYTKHLKNKTQAYPGMIETICMLKCMDIDVFCNTNKPHADAVECLKYYFGADTFTDVIGQKEGIPVKPAPDGVYSILNKYHLKGDHVIYCGDSNVDMETAMNSGCIPVGALWGYRTQEELVKAGAHVLISKPTDLLDLINNEVSNE